MSCNSKLEEVVKFIDLEVVVQSVHHEVVAEHRPCGRLEPGTGKKTVNLPEVFDYLRWSIKKAYEFTT